MKRMLTIVVLCGMASTAAADGVYVTESVGRSSIGGELGGATGDGAMRVRLAGGIRRKNWAIEGWLAGDLAMGGGFEASTVACRGTGGGSGGCAPPSA